MACITRVTLSGYKDQLEILIGYKWNNCSAKKHVSIGEGDCNSKVAVACIAHTTKQDHQVITMGKFPQSLCGRVSLHTIIVTFDAEALSFTMIIVLGR